MYLVTLVFFFLLHHLILTTASSSPTPNYPADDFAINCGSSGNSIALDGREWTGDIVSQQSTFSQHPSGKSVSSKEVPQSLYADHIPYMTARISHSQFAYTFQVSSGQKFIRLHFYPASYPGFERSKAFFNVKAGAYTLLSNFSASLTADALGLKSFAKEFCVNVEENQALSITFSPSPSSTSDSIYAFVNGIEIISMPTGLYYTPDGDPGARVVGQKHWFHIDNRTALELVQRLNVGGSSILSVEDWGMFRRWSPDSNYLLESGVSPVTISIPIKYTNIPTYAAPQRVYQTAWSMDPNKQANKMCNLTWKFPVDMGFRYLVRLHFCELDYGIKESGQREFGIYINNNTAEARADLIKWSGENGVAVYKDYVVMMDGNRMEGKRDLLIALQPHYYESRSKYHTGAVLNGVEVFKLSNPDNSLAGQNPEPVGHAPSSTTPMLQKLLSLFGNGNAIVSGLIILITLLNIIVFQLHLWAENVGRKKQVDEITQSTAAQQPTGIPVSMQDNIPDTPKERSNKKTITKVVQSMAKGMDLRRRKTEPKDSSSGWSRSWSRGMSTTEAKPSSTSPESTHRTKLSTILLDSPRNSPSFKFGAHGDPPLKVRTAAIHAYNKSNDSFGGSSVKSEGRIIYYRVANDDGNIEEGKEEPSFHFEGHNLEELTEKLEKETGLEDLIVCLRNPWNGKLSPLCLDLPPSNKNMHFVVVPSSSKAASDFAPDTSTSS